MSQPVFPATDETYSFETSVSQILTSIALEEISLSHVINAEGEKLQFILGTLPGRDPPVATVEDILYVNDNLKELISTVSMSQMYLFAKMNAAFNAYFQHKQMASEPGGPDVGPDDHGVSITSGNALVAGDSIYMPQYQYVDLVAQMTAPRDILKWLYPRQAPGVNFSAVGDTLRVRATSEAVYSRYVITAACADDELKYDTKMIVILGQNENGAVAGADGKLYVDYGDNTFKEMSPGGVTMGSLICGGPDGRPGNADDRFDIFVSEWGIKYLGPNPDGSFQRAGSRGLLGASDDVYVWPIDSGKPIKPGNEAAGPVSPY